MLIIKEYVYYDRTRLQKDPQKIKDLIFIAERFKEVLTDRKLLDYPGLLFTALKRLSSNTQGVINKLYCYAIPQNCEMMELEKKFFERLTDGNYSVVIVPQPEGYKKPKNLVVTDCKSPQNYLAKDIIAIRKKTIGKANEVKDVLRGIKNHSIALDQVIILYTGKEYAQIVYDLFARYKINITFDSGIPIVNSKAYCFLLNLLDWFTSGYEVKYLLYMLRSGNIDFKKAKKNKITNNRIARILEKQNIGWGLERYELLKDNNELGEIKEYESYLKDKKSTEIVYSFVKEATEMIDICDGKVNFSSINIVAVLKNVFNIKLSDIQKFIKNREKLSIFIELANEDSDTPIGQALNKLKSYFLRWKIDNPVSLTDYIVEDLGLKSRAKLIQDAGKTYTRLNQLLESMKDISNVKIESDLSKHIERLEAVCEKNIKIRFR